MEFGTLVCKANSDLKFKDFFNKVVDHPGEYFRTCCDQIMNNRCDLVNLSIFNHAVLLLTHTDPYLISSKITDSITTALLSFYDILNQSFNDGSFQIANYIEAYQTFYERTQYLQKAISYYNKNVKIFYHNKEYPLVQFTRNLLFYRIIVTQNYDDQNLYTKLISNSSLENLIAIFKQYSFFKKLAFSINEETSINSFSEIGTNKNMVRNIVSYIDENINNEDFDFSKVRSIVNIINSFEVKDLFFIYYLKFLETRLLSLETNYKRELEVVNLFTGSENNRFIVEMRNKINDYEEYIVRDRAKFQSVDVTENKSYADVPFDNKDLKKFNIFAMTYGVWADSKIADILPIKPPRTLEVYLFCYDRFYSTVYPNRKLEFNFNVGNAIINMIFDKKYTFQLTLPQLFVLKLINERGQINAKEISKELNFPLRLLAPILNVFLSIDMIKKEEGDNTDPTKKFFVNRQFSKDETKISLVPRSQKVNDQEVEDKFMIGCINIIKAAIVRSLKKEGKVKYTKLFNTVSQLVPFTLTGAQFKQSVNECIEEEYASWHNQTMLVYCLEEDSDSDSESD